MSNLETLLIVGGSFAGLRLVKKLAGKYKIVLVDRKQYFEYTPLILEAIAGNREFSSIAFPYENILPPQSSTFQFFNGELTKLYSNKAEISKVDGSLVVVPFDKCVLTFGSTYSPPLKTGKTGNADVTYEGREKQILQAHQEMVKANKILIIGGGAAAIELASEVVHFRTKNSLTSQIPTVTVVTNQAHLMADHEVAVQTVIDKDFASRKHITVLYDQDGKRVKEEGDWDCVFNCWGIEWNTKFLADSPDFGGCREEPKGRLNVNEFFQLKDIRTGKVHENIYSVGDLNNVKDAKLAYNAEIQAEGLAANLDKQREGKGQTPWRNPVGGIEVIPVRPRCIAIYNNLVFFGWLMFISKVFVNWTKVMQIKGWYWAEVLWNVTHIAVNFLDIVYEKWLGYKKKYYLPLKEKIQRFKTGNRPKSEKTS